jgi:FMN-dependent NADH-azoreductase
MQLLHIDSSVLGGNSVSRQLSARIVAEWQAARPGTQLAYLDLAADAPAHLDASALAPNALSEQLVSQFLAADVVVIGAPMYNFGIPSQLKAWIDRIAQAGRTFKYTEQGPVGLAGGKTVIIASSRGGVYSSNPALAFLDHQESYLKAVLGFFGVTDIRFVRAEGLNLGEAAKADAIANAGVQIQAHTSAAANEEAAALRA